MVDGYVCKRAGSDGDGRGSGHKLAGLKCMEKYGGQDNEHALPGTQTTTDLAFGDNFFCLQLIN